MDFMHQDSDTVFLTELFNEEHAALLFQQKLQLKPNFHKIILNNVGVKIMRDAFQKFEEQGIREVNLNYNWNEIMMFPKLVCYDKNTWKTLQQLSNWNNQWSRICMPCHTIEKVNINLVCSWADEQYVKAILQRLTRLPNIKDVQICVKAKNKKVGEILQAFEKAKIFPSFKGVFIEYE